MMAGGNMQRLVNLASLCDSLDYLADAMKHFGDHPNTRQSPLVCLFTPLSPSPHRLPPHPGLSGPPASTIAL